MIQKFYDDTLQSKFIKHLLATENIPLCSIVRPGEKVYKGQFYIYDCYLIFVLESGTFAISVEDILFPGNNVYPSDILFASTGGFTAKYKIVREYHYGEKLPQLTYSFTSDMSAYDPTTHIHLGRYLRYRSKMYGLNLMCFYNCYSGQTTDSVYMKQTPTSYKLENGQIVNRSEVSIIQSKNDAYKVYCVPIRFDTQYTVAIDCGSDLHIGFRLFNKSYGFIYDASHNDLSDHLKNRNFIKYTSSFTKPFIVSCDLSYNETELELQEQLYNFENDLEMLIQVPVTNDSSLVVLEGNYTEDTTITHNLLDKTLVDKFKSYHNYSDKVALQHLTVAEKHIQHSTKPLLLSLNAKANYAFSFTLIEHLLNNSICSTEKFPENIRKLHNLLRSKDTLYAYRCNIEELPESAWSSRSSDALRRQIALIMPDNYLTDMNDEFNVELERYYQNKQRINLENG